MTDLFQFQSDDGELLQAYAWKAEARPRAVIQIVHGMAEHAARYSRLATSLVERGFAVYGHDHRGHGGSVPHGEAPGHIADTDSFRRAAKDIVLFNREIEKSNPGVPIIILAHSMGSFMIQRILTETPEIMAGAILSGSNGKPPPIAQAGRLMTRIEKARIGSTGRSALIHKLSFGDFNKPFEPARTEYDWLSRDPAEVDKYIEDPLAGFVCSVQVWLDLIDALVTLTLPEELAKIPKDMPIFCLAGSEDPVGGARGVKSLVSALRAAWLTDVELKLYEGGRHEMLNEINRDEVTADIVRFCERVIAKKS